MSRSLLAAAALALAVPAAAQAESTLQVGQLTCTLSGGTNLILLSTAEFDCAFDPAGDGAIERYTGEIEKIGIDLSTTEDSTIVWAVVAPAEKFTVDALEGTYVGASADVSVVAGVGVRALVGGDQDLIQLQPISVEAQEGFGAALGLESFKLTPQ